MKNFEEFKIYWEKYSGKRKTKQKPDMLFVMVYREDLPWSFATEKQCQTLVNQISGGLTGSAADHQHILCYKSEVEDILKNTDCTHAMILAVGMVFDVTVTETSTSMPKTAIKKFYDFTESDLYCKGHILCHRGKPATIHHQHIELNLVKWKEFGCPSIYGGWNNFERSDENFHDDYTPPWIIVEINDQKVYIQNFDNDERKNKSFAYPHLSERQEIHERNWKHLTETKRFDYDWGIHHTYFKLLCSRLQQTYYIKNTEKLGNLPAFREFDLIMSPTAGYNTELLARNMMFEGELVFYDYCDDNLKMKRLVYEMHLTPEQTLKAAQFLQINCWNPTRENDFKKLEEYGSDENMMEAQTYVRDKCDVSFSKTDLMTFNYDDFKHLFKNKHVFFNASNIFGYHNNHIHYTLDHVINKYEELLECLKTHSKSFHFRGTNPGKEKVYHENILR